MKPTTASRYRSLARIPDEVFERYVAHAAERNRVPSSRGLENFATSEKLKDSRSPRKNRVKKQSVPMAGPKELLQAVKGFMSVDVCVGSVAFADCKPIDPDLLQVKHLKGNALVVECPDPGRWLPKLRELWSRTQVVEVIVLLPATTGEAWFRAVEDGDWHCCFLRSPDKDPLLAAYQGKRKQAFRLAFKDLGPVLHAGEQGQ
jgi:hypothetical protein